MGLHILIAVISTLALTIHGFPADVQNGPTENNPSVVPGVFISVDTLKNLQDQALQNNQERNSEGNQATSNPEKNLPPISQPINLNQEPGLVNQRPLIGPNSLQDLPNRHDLINQQLMNQQSLRPNQQQIYVDPQQQFVQKRPINQQVVNQQPMLANQQYLVDQQQLLPINQQQYLPNQQSFQGNQQYLVEQQQRLPINQQQYLPNQQPFQGNQQYLVEQQQQLPINQQQLRNEQPFQGNQQQYPSNQQQTTYEQPIYPNQQQIPNQLDQVWQNGQPQRGYIQQNQQTPLNQEQSMLLAVSPINNGQILAAKPVNLAPLNQNQGSTLYAIVPLNNGQNAMPTQNIGGSSYLVPNQQIAVISTLALTVHGLPSDEQNNPSMVPGVFITIETPKNPQDQALHNNPERNNEGNEVTTNSEQVVASMSQLINSNQLSIPQPQEPVLVNRQPSIASNTLQVVPNKQDNIKQQLMNQQSIRPNQQQFYMNSQKQFLQQPPTNQHVLPNQQQLLAKQHPMLPNQHYLVDKRQQQISVNQQQYLRNQHPFQRNQKQYLANQQQLTYQQPMYLKQQQIPNQLDQAWQNGQAQAGYTQQNQQISLNQGQSTLLAVNPINNGQILATKPQNLAPFNQNQGSMLYAILPLINGQNAMPARNIGGNSYLVPYQQVPSNQVYALNNRK